MVLGHFRVLRVGGCGAAFSPGWVGGYLVFLWDCEFWICLFVSA